MGPLIFGIIEVLGPRIIEIGLPVRLQIAYYVLY